MDKTGHKGAVGPSGAIISAWLRAAREAAGLARRAASVRLDVAERTVVRWEDPEDPALPPADQFLNLVVFYKADVMELLAAPSTPKARAPRSPHSSPSMPIARSPAANAGAKKRPEKRHQG